MYSAANPPPVLPDDHTIVPTMLLTAGGTRGAWGTAAGHSLSHCPYVPNAGSYLSLLIIRVVYQFRDKISSLVHLISEGSWIPLHS